MSIDVGAIVKPRTDKENLGIGEVTRSVKKKDNDGPRTKRWVVAFTLPDGSKAEREFTSRQLSQQEPSPRKQAAAKKTGKKTGPSRNQKRKARKRRAKKPLSAEASSLMQQILKATGTENNGDGGLNPSSPHLSADSDTDDSNTPKTTEQPSQPLLSDHEGQSSSDGTTAAVPNRGIGKGSRVKTRSGGQFGTVVKARGRWQWEILFDGNNTPCSETYHSKSLLKVRNDAVSTATNRTEQTATTTTFASTAAISIGNADDNSDSNSCSNEMNSSAYRNNQYESSDDEDDEVPTAASSHTRIETVADEGDDDSELVLSDITDSDNDFDDADLADAEENEDYDRTVSDDHDMDFDFSVFAELNDSVEFKMRGSYLPRKNAAPLAPTSKNPLKRSILMRKHQPTYTTRQPRRLMYGNGPKI